MTQRNIHPEDDNRTCDSCASSRDAALWANALATMALTECDQDAARDLGTAIEHWLQAVAREARA